MPLKPAELATLSRLLEQALALETSELEPWLGSLSEEHRELVPRLRRMLTERSARGHTGFLAAGPRLETGRQDREEAAHRAGDAVGVYRLIRPLGRGGMSTVWLAERADGVVKRIVALKMPLLTLASPQQVERFERERDVLALLAHPLIARLYDAGVTDSGQPFIVLEYIDGLPITEACDVRGLDVASRLQAFLGVLAAVDHAHKHLVVHRDIKPSNVFLDADGQVRLLDFGVAKLLDPAGDVGPSELTRDAGVALTPRYAAPEQLDRRPISTATDVYSLGMLLHELLVGQLPHADRQASMADAIDAALHEVPLAPSRASIDPVAARCRGGIEVDRLRSQLAGDLDVIVLKALRKDPAERYGWIESFSDDIRRFLEHRPIRARRPTVVHRARLYLRRHRGIGAAAALGMIVAAILGTAAYDQHRRTLDERARGDSVRDFMFDLVNDAEADEQHPDREPTGRQMVAGAVLRARQNFPDQPRLRGELLAELGWMSGKLNDDGEATSLLREALGLLEPRAPAGDAALNRTRSRLAEAVLGQGEVDRAESLARSALTACVDGRDCAKVRSQAGIVLTNVDLRRGRSAEALAAMRQSVADSEAGFGPVHTETALAWLGLAVVSRQVGKTDAARAALDRALVLAHDVVLRHPDRIEMLRTQALLSFDVGAFADASARFARLRALARDREARAQLWRLQAGADFALGDMSAALAASASGLSSGETPPGSVEAQLLHQAHARALSVDGRIDEALAEMRPVVDGLRAAGFAAGAMEVLRARRFLAEMSLRAGRYDDGLAALQAVYLDQSKTSGQDPETAQTADLIGCAFRELGRWTEAREWHLKAGTLLGDGVADGHPARLRNRLYLALADYRASPTPPTLAALARAADAYRSAFAAESVWRQRVDATLQALSCQGATACALVL